MFSILYKVDHIWPLKTKQYVNFLEVSGKEGLAAVVGKLKGSGGRSRYLKEVSDRNHVLSIMMTVRILHENNT
jgi:hypothetical protein